MNKIKLSDVKKLIKKRPEDSYKGKNGSVLVIGGCEHYVSAPALSALAALRTGIDFIQVASSEKAAYAINGFSIDFITKKMKGDFLSDKHIDELLEFAADFDAVLLGPGLGKRPETKSFVNSCVSKCEVPLIIDADGIQQLDLGNVKGLLTPHKREFEILFGIKPPKDLKQKINLVQSKAKEYRCTILLKGPIDIISDGKNTKLNYAGNPGMTVAGTGDLLSGLCAGFIAQKNSLFDSACGAAYVNGAIGDELKKTKGYGFVSSDFIPLIADYIYKKTKVKL